MVKYKWNISKEDGRTIVFSNLKDIFSLEKTNQLELNDLIKKLLIKTKDIDFKNYKKKKNIINFIKTNFGSFINLLDTNCDYGIRYISDKTYIYYFGNILDEWELI